MPTAEIKKLKSALKARQGQEGIDELSKAYSEGTTEKKREILNKYIEDRTLSFRFEVAQETEFSKTESSITTGRWMTLKQIAQREGMALDDPHLQLVITRTCLCATMRIQSLQRRMSSSTVWKNER